MPPPPPGPAPQRARTPRLSYSAAAMTETTDARRHFFISFTGADRPWARWLARTLTEAGYTYWFQDQDFHGSIPRSIGEAHTQSERTILLLSDAYARSGGCRAEWEARHMDDPGGAKDLL